MRLVTRFSSLLLLVLWFSQAWGQTAGPSANTSSDNHSTEAKVSSEAEQPEKAQIWVRLGGGRRLEVDEITEASDGYWYTRGNITTFLDRNRVEKIERTEPTKSASAYDASVGRGRWKLTDAATVERFFVSRFGRPLPVGAAGQSELHTRWGLDHRDGLDVSLHPDSAEGQELIGFLRREAIPFMAFRSAIPRVATGPHIHIGNPSPRVTFRE
jgi:hypothetical protein